MPPLAGRLRRRRLWTVAATLLLALPALCVTACEIEPPPKPPRRTADPPDAVAACSRATATTRTDRAAPNRSFFVPAVGPLSVNIDEHTDGYPTKVVIHPKSRLPESLTLTGSRCSDGLPLLFWFEDGVPPLPTAGDDIAILEPVGADVAYTGYLLFTTKGRWQLTVAQGGTELGVLVIEVI